ncbi:hypothetical protein [Ktedonobacter racemifer]|uniref:Short-chain dehydrogenase/reductase SDR n=1 Tax=Ktedonobacter racemifer DSM 44963 TaxID=485913 RepID=D6TI86_KTERA|nr:hypothetical protein [Ktedonobacter racemifer]EFH89143.1 short-chain dehydrogenase/reductase SDR [Ktedonobacter racemifer DSM 44963]
MPPEKAAAVILRVVEANRARILIGQDARLIYVIQRFAPVRGPALLQRVIANALQKR